MKRENLEKKIAIVGSGPAGLACAYFLANFGYSVTVFEAEHRLGGIPQIGIPEYRLPRVVLNKEIEDILSLGIEVRLDCRVGKDIELTELFESMRFSSPQARPRISDICPRISLLKKNRYP